MLAWYASKPHYAHHIQHHLEFYSGDIRRLERPSELPAHTAPIFVAGRRDAAALAPRPVILIEHGVGQSYLVTDRHGETRRHDAGNAPPSDNVVEHWAPNRIAVDAMNDRNILPNAAAPRVGAPHLYQLARARLNLHQRHTVPHIAVACHWASPIAAPEAAGAWPWVTLALRQLRYLPLRAVVTLVPHPLLGGQMRRHRFTRDPSVLVEPHWPTVLAHADIVVADNTSMLWEAAALDVPTVAVWPPHWRNRKLVPHHGLRFPGPNFIPHPRDCDEPTDIVATIRTLVDRWNRRQPDHATKTLGETVRHDLYPQLADTPDLAAEHLERVATVR